MENSNIYQANWLILILKTILIKQLKLGNHYYALAELFNDFFNVSQPLHLCFMVGSFSRVSSPLL